ncbi:Na+/H+ antiporter NhaC [Desulfitispora alkaliphila]|uniref:Na+/H+ antiporter NhaC family protein n=1 Tax=Desulfitispora alkaliphila TaxID=622674 RepID=UPI003D21C9E3
MNEETKPNGFALIPFLVFVAIFLGSGILLELQGVEYAFYQLPAPVAAMCGIITAFLLFKGTVEEKFNDLVKGCGNKDIIIMCIIYLLAGGFAAVTKAMGGIDSTVNLGLTYIPAEYITAGIFLISVFISVATGSSMGSIAAVAPIAVALAHTAGLNMPLTLAAVLGGCMCGDNLSIISDTTIAATRTQGVAMKDKFKVNFFIVLPALIITVILLLIFGRPETVVEIETHNYDLIKVMPYIFVLVAAIAGMNVLTVLTGGILISGTIGLAYRELTVLTFTQEIYNGFNNMFEIFLLSMLTGGLAYMVTKAGGIQFLLEKIQSFISGKKSAELGTAFLVSATDAAVANNTVAIIISGPIAKKISTKFQVDPRRNAAILDIFSCVVQGMIPYGAQMLLIASLSMHAVSPLQIIPLLWYQILLALAAIISIYLPFANGVINKNPWKWEQM